MSREKHPDLTSGPILKTLTELALPIMASSFLGTAYNLTDMAWIGMLGAKAVEMCIRDSHTAALVQPNSSASASPERTCPFFLSKISKILDFTVICYNFPTLSSKTFYTL